MRAILCPSSAAAGSGRRPRAAAGVLPLGLSLGLCLGLGLTPTDVRAASYVIEAQSPAGTGLAGAMSARADDASAIFYNPAGLGYQSGLSIVAGVSLAAPTQTATLGGGDPFKAVSSVFVLPTLYVAGRLSDRLAIGLGVFTHHGGGANWENPDETRPFQGRFLTLRTRIQSVTFNPTLTIRVTEELSIGGGVDVEMGSLEIVRNLALASAEGRIALSGSSLAVGGNAGVLARLLDGRLNFALTFRSAINMQFNDMKVGITAPPGVSLPLPYTQGKTEIPTPHTITLGMAGKPMRALTLSVDVLSSLWSSVHEQRIVTSDGMLRSQTTIVPRAYHDTYGVRIKTELDVGQLLPASSKLSPKVRLGFGYDPTPVPTSTLGPSAPDGDRLFPAVGLALGYRGIGSIEAGYQAVFFLPSTAENQSAPLTYNTMIHLVSVALNVQLERVFGRRSPAFSARLLDRSPPEANDDSAAPSTESAPPALPAPAEG